MIIENILLELEQHRTKENVFKIGYIKEYLQTIVLGQIYELDECKHLIFYGGTAMRFLLGLNRLSEDLDFIGRGFTDFDFLGKSLQLFFKKNNIVVQYKVQKFRILLNFKNVLEHFGIRYGNSNDLYIKIEISDDPNFCHPETKLYPLFKFNQALVLRSFDSSTLFASKLNAVLHRKWQKQLGPTFVSVKGRDIYDLFWYLSKGITPNIDCVIGISTLGELKEKLIETIEKIDFGEVVYDIQNFVEDATIVVFIRDHGKEYILEKIGSW